MNIQKKNRAAGRKDEARILDTCKNGANNNTRIDEIIAITPNNLLGIPLKIA